MIFAEPLTGLKFNSRNVDDEVVADQENIKSFACRDNDEILCYLMNDDPSDTFANTKTRVKFSSQMDDGQYEVNWIDIRTGKTVRSEKISRFPAELTTPEFKDGLFGYISKN